MRNRVISNAVVLLAYALTAKAWAAPPAAPATILFVHGHIYTSNPSQPWATAMAVRGNEIEAVGSDPAMMAYRGPNTQVIDLGGRMAMPGIIDDHQHIMWASYEMTGLNASGARTEAQLRRQLHDYAAAHPGSGWVWGRYEGVNDLSVTPRRLLDEYFPNRPVVLLQGSQHDLWANSKALALAGITHTTPNPHGRIVGTIVRDSQGRATGMLEEGAKRLVLRKAQFPRSEELSKFRAGLAYDTQHGITSAIAATGDLHQMGIIAELHRQGELTVRVTSAYGTDVGVRHTLSPSELADLAKACRLYPRSNDWTRACLVKYFGDGVLEVDQSAGMLEPYTGIPGYRGPTLYTEAELRHQFLVLDRLGYQVMTHIIGDRTAREVLDAYAYVEREDGPRDRRWRVEHMEEIAPTDWPRLGQLHVIAAFQPWGVPDPDSDGGKWMGPSRMIESTPWQSVVQDGALLSLGSDWPVEPSNPFPIMQIAILRENGQGKPFFPNQRLTLDQVLTAYTRNNAYTDFMEKRIGSLEPGKLADFIVLSQNLYTIPSNQIGKTKVLLTMVGGKIVWRQGM